MVHPLVVLVVLLVDEVASEVGDGGGVSNVRGGTRRPGSPLAREARVAAIAPLGGELPLCSSPPADRTRWRAARPTVVTHHNHMPWGEGGDAERMQSDTTSPRT
jgi:hypothetical protein